MASLVRCNEAASFTEINYAKFQSPLKQ
jgi:hypothetical protein